MKTKNTYKNKILFRKKTVMMRVLEMEKINSDELRRALQIASIRRDDETEDIYNEEIERNIEIIQQIHYSYQVFHTRNSYKMMERGVFNTYRDEIEVRIITKGIKKNIVIKDKLVNLGMVTKQFERRAVAYLKTRWMAKFFYNKELSMRQMNRQINRGEFVNGASILSNRIKQYLREAGKIEGNEGEEAYSVTAITREEKREWMKSFGDIKLFHDFIKYYDLSVYGIHANSTRGLNVVKLDLHVKDRDEGYCGGLSTIGYEIERIREEKKIRRMRKQD